VLLAGQVLDLTAGRAGGQLGLAAGLAEHAVRLGASVVDGLVGQRLGLLHGVGRVALGLDAARLGPLLDLLGPLLGVAGATLGLGHQLVGVRDGGGVALPLLALGLLPALGELERE